MKARLTRWQKKYRQAPAAELADLNENRYRINGEEATALDRVMADPALKSDINLAIDKLDRRKRIIFRQEIFWFVAGTILTTLYTLFHNR